MTGSLDLEAAHFSRGGRVHLRECGVRSACGAPDRSLLLAWLGLPVFSEDETRKYFLSVKTH